MRLTPAGKFIILVIVLLAGYGALRALGLFKPKEGATSVNVKVGDLSTPAPSENGGGGTAAPEPGKDTCKEGVPVRLLGYAWNAQLGMLYASGGVDATQGSAMCNHGVRFNFARQDMNDKLMESLVAFATELKGGNPQPTKGVHFVTIMGDGGAAFLKGLNDQLAKIGPEYKAKVVGAAGYSRGEDKFMGPAAWKQSPLASRGGVVAGVLRDGDWNIAQKWLSDNGLKTNPDEKTYDPDALNWVAADDYLKAVEMYNTGYSEDRPVVRNGKPTGERKKIVVQGVVTWTPGDVNVATKKGGLVSIVSTKDYASQMPCILIGIDKWMKQNRKTVEGMLQAIAEGGQSVKSSDAALTRAADIGAAAFKEESGPYWKKYFKGVVEKDSTGQDVELGGSSVNNLGDMLATFGLNKGGDNLFAATYKVFGDVVVAQYPNLVPNYPPVSEILDTSYLQGVMQKATPASVQVPRVAVKSAPITQQISKRVYNITFQTGRAVFSPQATSVLQGLKRDALIASGLAIEVHGHTDNVGDPQKNMQLSEDRAFAVKRWLEQQSSSNFPEGRVRVFAHGQQNPRASNSTEEGRSRNRRVEIILGK